jgi:hypothetical protein
MTRLYQDKNFTASDDRTNIQLSSNELEFLFLFFQRLLRMVDGLNFKDFVAFLSTFSSKASPRQKFECMPSLFVSISLFYSYLCDLQNPR